MRIKNKIIVLLLLVNVGRICAGAGRDNNILAPVQACGDGVLSGVNTISCVQTVSATSSGSMSGSGSPLMPASSPTAPAA